MIRDRTGHRNSNYSHGMTDSPEYRSYHSMRARCLRPTDKRWPLYGGRGITICTRWLASFEAFYADMGTRPPGTSLDRIDVNGNYEPGNCRWADQKTQRRNSRNVKLNEALAVEIRELYMRGAHPQALAERFGVVRGSIDHVVAGRHWDGDGHSIKRPFRSNTQKLTEDQVRTIRASSESHAALGRKFGVTSANVRAIRERRTWASLA